MMCNTGFEQSVASIPQGQERDGGALASGDGKRKITTYASPIGALLLEMEGPTLKALRVATSVGENVSQCDNALVLRWLDCFFSGNEPDFLPPLDPHGTPFQRRVWQELLKIPYGSTVTYGELARRVGCRSAQAVGQAVARNPIAIVIPCHRVVASDGLGGYAYGSCCKQKLLELEATTH